MTLLLPNAELELVTLAFTCNMYSTLHLSAAAMLVASSWLSSLSKLATEDKI